MKKDLLLQYCEAVDRHDLGQAEAIWWQMYYRNAQALDTALLTLLNTFDPHESFTEQLVRIRNEKGQEIGII
jgi:hypothetical protein